ncbi:hypothetical protein [Kitasatospora viridis]|uniref:Ig-like domain-containing protein n=1 Tax=Kitasatospora viridis TaxID=281105 RepID=A0A561S9Q9_9ACTN|nr:hypothetical protein [Kitasatospora viridis]TWF71577.1 hypothetical protein FHX73_19207 [Kitasatospora viridis]
MNRIIKHAAAVLLAACSIGALSATTASAQDGGTVYSVANLNHCHGQMNTVSMPNRQVQLAVSADDVAGTAVTCTAQLYTYQAGATGPVVTATNGTSVQGDWADDNGTYKYVCVSEMDINLATAQPSGSYAGCTIMY